MHRLWIVIRIQMAPQSRACDVVPLRFPPPPPLPCPQDHAPSLRANQPRSFPRPDGRSAHFFTLSTASHDPVKCRTETDVKDVISIRVRVGLRIPLKQIEC